MINLNGIRSLYPYLKIRMNQEKQKNVVIQYTFMIADEKKEVSHSVRSKKLDTIRSLELLEEEIINICKTFTNKKGMRED